MRKKTLVILTIIGWGLLIVGMALAIPAWVVFASSFASCSPDCSTPPSNVGLIFTGIAVGYLFIFAASILHIIAWIGVLIKQAKQQQWAWFVCTILFSYICTTIYLIAVPEMPEVQMVPVYAQQPYYPAQPYYGQPMPPMQQYQPDQPRQEYPPQG